LWHGLGVAARVHRARLCPAENVVPRQLMLGLMMPF
jgi:hypothetical protein